MAYRRGFPADLLRRTRIHRAEWLRIRPHALHLARRLADPRRFIQAVTGPRQVGKTTLVRHVAAASGIAVQYASADEPTLRGGEWIAQQWEAARYLAPCTLHLAREAGRAGAIRVLDEVQKISR